MFVRGMNVMSMKGGFVGGEVQSYEDDCEDYGDHFKVFGTFLLSSEIDVTVNKLAFNLDNYVIFQPPFSFAY